MIRPFVSLVLAASTLPALLPAQTSHHPPARASTWRAWIYP